MTQHDAVSLPLSQQFSYRSELTAFGVTLPQMTTSRKISPIGQRIMDLLKETGLSQNAASLKAGLSRDAIRNIIRAPDLMPNTKTVIALAEVLGSTPAYVLTGDHFGHSEIDEEIERHDGIRDGIRYGGIVEAGAFRLNDSTNQDASTRKNCAITFRQ